MSYFSAKNYSQIFIVALVVFNMVLIGLLWMNKGSKAMGPPPKDLVFHLLSKELELNEEQKGKIRELRKANREQMIPIQKKLHETRKKIFLLHADGKNDLAEIDSLTQRIGELHARLEVQTFKHFQDIKNMCRPEQQQKFDVLLDKLLQRMAGPGHRRGPKGPGGPPPHGRP